MFPEEGLHERYFPLPFLSGGQVQLELQSIKAHTSVFTAAFHTAISALHVNCVTTALFQALRMQIGCSELELIILTMDASRLTSDRLLPPQSFDFSTCR